MDLKIAVELMSGHWPSVWGMAIGAALVISVLIASYMDGRIKNKNRGENKYDKLERRDIEGS